MQRPKSSLKVATKSSFLITIKIVSLSATALVTDFVYLIKLLNSHKKSPSYSLVSLKPSLTIQLPF